MNTVIKRAFVSVWMGLLGMGLVAAAAHAAETRLKPFVLASNGPGDLKPTIAKVKQALTSHGFKILGQYSPYAGAEIFAVTNGDLMKAAQQSPGPGGAYAVAQRVSVTQVGKDVQVAYTNPVYMADAYHMNTDLANVAAQLKTALGEIKTFGSHDGMTPNELRDYHYTFGMEYFSDPYHLGSYGSYDQALKKVEAGMAAHKGGCTEVYHVAIPGRQETVFGVSLQQGPKGSHYADDKYQMNVVDAKPLKHTAYLPYEILVTGSKVRALHMRFRMALYFPDLRMLGSHSFMTLMPAPSAMRKALTECAGGHASSSEF
ncbi:MAG: hypothetical protein KGJ12_05355 [Gammaproteobacteria bacterium]|nr:hypothetical protein [Gammaproteobacteria bacterium]